MTDLVNLIGQVTPIDSSWLEKANARQNRLTKPPLSLGRLEEIACRVAAIQQTLKPRVKQKRVAIFAGDHGITDEGVSPYPSEVTAQMVTNFLAGGAAINALAQSAGADLVIVDAGVRAPVLLPQVEPVTKPIHFVQSPIRKGSRNFIKGPALTPDEVLAAIRLGYQVAQDAKQAGIEILGIGEMGIGNTTAAAAITAALTGLKAADVTGRGTGASDDILLTKRSVVERALQLHAPDKNDALQILRAFGGLEIAGLTGLCLAAAAERLCIVCDGFIASASAALAVRMCPAVADYLFAAHLSVEPGHAALLEILGQKPLLSLNMRLGEGTGAALAMSIIDGAVRAFTEMATFASAGVSDKESSLQEASGR